MCCSRQRARGSRELTSTSHHDAVLGPAPLETGVGGDLAAGCVVSLNVTTAHAAHAACARECSNPAPSTELLGCRTRVCHDDASQCTSREQLQRPPHRALPSPSPRARRAPPHHDPTRTLHLTSAWHVGPAPAERSPAGVTSRCPLTAPHPRAAHRADGRGGSNMPLTCAELARPFLPRPPPPEFTPTTIVS